MLHISSHIIIYYVLYHIISSYSNHIDTVNAQSQVSLPWTSCGNAWNNNDTCTIPSDVSMTSDRLRAIGDDRWWVKTKAWWATPAQPKNISNGRFSRCTRATALLSESASSLSSSSFYDIYHPPPQPWSNQAQPCSLHFNSLRSRLLRPLEGRQVHRKGYFFIIWFLSLFFIFSLKGGLGDSNSPLCCSILPSNQVEST